MVKLICSAKSIPLELVDVDFQNMKTDRAAYPFGQCEWHEHASSCCWASSAARGAAAGAACCALALLHINTWCASPPAGPRMVDGDVDISQSNAMIR